MGFLKEFRKNMLVKKYSKLFFNLTNEEFQNINNNVTTLSSTREMNDPKGFIEIYLYLCAYIIDKLELWENQNYFLNLIVDEYKNLTTKYLIDFLEIQKYEDDYLKLISHRYSIYRYYSTPHLTILFYLININPLSMKIPDEKKMKYNKKNTKFYVWEEIYNSLEWAFLPKLKPIISKILEIGDVYNSS